MEKYKVVFFGTPEFAVPSLKVLINSESFEVVTVVTQADKPVGRKQVLMPSPIKEVALANHIPVLQPVKVKKNEEFLSALKELGADVNVAVAYGKILPQEVLDAARHGSVNVHGSELPKYRGASPIHAAILNGDADTRVTVQKMVFEMDEGPILGYGGSPIEISAQDTYESLSSKMADSASEVLPQILFGYLQGTIIPVEQEHSKASYVQLIKKEDGQINWEENEELISRKIRAYYPWPTAFTDLDGMQVKILSAEYVESVDNPKGVIADIEKELFIGKIRINKLQLAGKNPITGKEFLHGYAKYVGHHML